MRMPNHICTEVEVYHRLKFYQDVHTVSARLNTAFFVLFAVSLVVNVLSVQMYGIQISVATFALFLLTLFILFASQKLTEFSTFVDDGTMQALLDRSLSYPLIHGNLVDYIRVRPRLTRQEYRRFLAAIEQSVPSPDAVG